jgi:hypothetical protein
MELFAYVMLAMFTVFLALLGYLRAQVLELRSQIKFMRMDHANLHLHVCVMNDRLDDVIYGDEESEDRSFDHDWNDRPTDDDDGFYLPEKERPFDY